MHEDMRMYLNAYLDGELHGVRLQEFTKHLAGCETCQKELKELRLVSSLLKSAPAPEFMPAERFTSNLALRLPRRSLQAAPARGTSLAWWLAPVGILGAWFFVQTLFTLSGALNVLQSSGLPGVASAIPGNAPETLWFAATSGLFGGQVAGAHGLLAWLNSLNLFSLDLLDGFLWKALIAMLYWVWLAAWWLLRRPRTGVETLHATSLHT